jgi:hypothetical protein
MRAPSWRTLRSVELLRWEAARVIALADSILFGRPSNAAGDALRLLPALHRLRVQVQLTIDTLEQEGTP